MTRAKQVREDPDELFEAGNEHDAAGRRDEAVAAWRRVVELDPAHGDAWFNLGVAAKEEERWQDALELFTRALEHDPDEAATLHCRGHMYQELGLDSLGRADLERAIAAYSAALDDDGEDAEVWFWRGAARARLGERSEALADLATAIKLDPGRRKEAREEVDYRPLASEPEFVILTRRTARRKR